MFDVKNIIKLRRLQKLLISVHGNNIFPVVYRVLFDFKIFFVRFYTIITTLHICVILFFVSLASIQMYANIIKNN
jgi:hypothetical protein